MRRLLISILILACLLSSLVLPLSAQARPITPGKKITLSDCDTKEGWSSSGQMFRDRIEKTEGKASIAARAGIAARSQSTFYMAYSFPAQSLVNMDQLEFDIYLSDLTLLDTTFAFSALLSSSGNEKQETLTWTYALYDVEYHEGWNHVVLSLNQATSTNFDYSKACYFRLNFARVSPEEDLVSYVQLDNITVSAYDSTYSTFLTCETTEGWHTQGTAPYLDYTDCTEGDASIAYKVELGDNTAPPNNQVVANYNFDAMDVSWANYIEMDVYLSSLDVLPRSAYGIQFELTSSGRCDRNEMCWTLDNYVWKTGWNHIRMPFAGARQNGGDTDLTAVNYIRFHIIRIEPIMRSWIFKVDNIRFSSVAIPESAEPDTPDRPGLPVNPQVPVNPDLPGIPETPDDPEVPDVPTDPTEPEVPVDPEEPSEPEQPGQPSFPNWPDVPIIPVEPETPTEDDTGKSMTATKAKITGISMAFAIIGADVVVMSVRKRSLTNKESQEEQE